MGTVKYYTLRVDHLLSFEAVAWATAQVYGKTNGKPTKAKVLEYLRGQVAQFGDDDMSLMGEREWRQGLATETLEDIYKFAHKVCEQMA